MAAIVVLHQMVLPVELDCGLFSRVALVWGMLVSSQDVLVSLGTVLRCVLHIVGDPRQGTGSSMEKCTSQLLRHTSSDV